MGIDGRGPNEDEVNGGISQSQEAQQAPEQSELVDPNKERIAKISNLIGENYQFYLEALADGNKEAAQAALVEHVADQLQALETVAYGIHFGNLPEKKEDIDEFKGIGRIANIAQKNHGDDLPYIDRFVSNHIKTVSSLWEAIYDARYEAEKGTKEK